MNTEKTMLWNLKTLLETPKTYPALGFEAQGVKSLFYEGLPWKGKPTRVFAWYGVHEIKTGEKFPAMVLVHGGGGTAFDDWVRLWNRRGYGHVSETSLHSLLSEEVTGD